MEMSYDLVLPDNVFYNRILYLTYDGEVDNKRYASEVTDKMEEDGHTVLTTLFACTDYEDNSVVTQVVIYMVDGPNELQKSTFDFEGMVPDIWVKTPPE